MIKNFFQTIEEVNKSNEFDIGKNIANFQRTMDEINNNNKNILNNFGKIMKENSNIQKDNYENLESLHPEKEENFKVSIGELEELILKMKSEKQSINNENYNKKKIEYKENLIDNPFQNNLKVEFKQDDNKKTKKLKKNDSLDKLKKINENFSKEKSQDFERIADIMKQDLSKYNNLFDASSDSDY